jgi:TonB-linked SusC/RagA family outer membrane protein
MKRIFKLMRAGTLVLITGLFFNPLFAQNREIRGHVSSAENSQPLQGVTVTVKGTKIATVTDNQGNYKLTVSSGSATLVFTSVGYTSYEAAIGSSGEVNATLTAEIKTGDDVVVIGYQSIRRKNLLASVSSVSSKDLKDIPINSAAEALNGRLAGVTATTAEGSPDADIRIRVRGGMSITGDNSPLYVIDGVQMENALSFVSPQDIQSIDVLKDAAATSIYGARGANGVILITTKSGRKGKARITYNGFVGIKKLARELSVLSPYDFVFYQSERARGSSTDSTTFTNNYGHTWDTLNVYKSIQNVDWQKETFGRTGITTTHNLGISGGSKLFTYNFGYTYNNEKAIVLNSNYRRHLLSFKGDYKVTKDITLGAIVRYTHQEVLGAGVSDDKGTAYNRLRNAVKYRPFLSNGQDIEDNDPIADPNVGNGLSLINPIRLANAEYRNKTTNTFNVTGTATYNIIKNLTFKSTFGYIETRPRDLQYYDSITPYSIIQGGAKPIARLDTTIQKTITNSNVLTYSVNDYKNKHDFSVLIGEESYDLRSTYHSNLFGQFPTFTSKDQAFSKTSLGVPFTGYPKLTRTRYTNISFFGRVNYSFKDRYLFSFNIRQDGASKFAEGNKWGTFPAGSVAWRIKNEKFMENVNFINDFKLRFGYGSNGNNRIADYLYLTTFRNDGSYYYGINNQAILAYYSGGLVNEALKWESTINRNFGIDLSMLKGRIDLSVDIYNNTSKDLLLNVPVASTFGYSSQIQNVGKTSNRGVEIQLGSVILRKANGLNWNANFNIAFNKNKILALGQGQKSFFPPASWGVSGQPNDYIEMIGQPVGSMWGLVTDGFYTTNDFDYDAATGRYTLKTGVVNDAGIIGTVMPGSIKFKDLNNDGIVDITNDSKIIGNPTPKFTGGLMQQFTYRRWDASIFVNFSYGNDIYNANKIELTNAYSNNSNMLAVMADRWKVVTPDGQTALWVNAGNVYGIPKDQLAALNANAKIWQPLKSTGAFYPHSWAIEDGSFLRINNVTLGYSIPAKSLGKIKLSQLRFYLTANNLALFTKYSGYDPEVSVRSNPLTPGLDYSAYPKSRSFIFGVNATF